MPGMVIGAHDWWMAPATVVLAGLLDVVLGEPPNALHPVAWMGRLIAALDGRRPRGRPWIEVVYGAAIVVTVVVSAASAGWLLAIGLTTLPWWVALPVGAAVLKTTFSLRGLVDAARGVQRALASDVTEARLRLGALVSRPTDLQPPLIVSAAVESLAENLTDSVVSPLLYGAVFGLPGALAYRGVNTLDAMLGYRDDREYVGKTAARSDDVANWLPTRLAALLLVCCAASRRRGGAAWAALRHEHRPEYGINKTLAIAAMAGALGVRLQKPQAYELGTPERPLIAAVIGDATRLVWVAGAVTIAAAAGLAGLVAWGVWT